jgi:hypothetical protein
MILRYLDCELEDLQIFAVVFLKLGHDHCTISYARQQEQPLAEDV